MDEVKQKIKAIDAETNKKGHSYLFCFIIIQG